MASEVDICNLALSWLGGSLITSLDDNSTEAKLCKANYAIVRDAVVESRDWTFAVQRYDLAKNATPPVNGYANGFQIPSTVLRVVEVNCGEDYRVEGNDIVTDENSVKIRAIGQVTDTSFFSPLFVQALAQRLAADIAIGLTQSRELQQQHWQLYLAKLDEAAANDGMQGKSRKITSNWLQQSRSGGSALAGPTVGSPSRTNCPSG